MALASAGARADGSTSGFLVAYGTLASFCCGDDVKRGSAATLDHQRSRVDRLVAANVAGLHLEAKLLHSGSVNFAALLASNAQHGSDGGACGSSNGVGSVVLAGAAGRARPDRRRAAAITDCG